MPIAVGSLRSRQGMAEPWVAGLVVALALQACAVISADAEKVDGQLALAHVAAITAFGPHPPGSPAQRKVGLYLLEQLKLLGLETRTHAFSAATPLGQVEMINIWGILPGKDPSVIILASHYDSKYFEDFSFVGANDGGSSCGIVLELARVLSAKNPVPHTFWFVFFDGEEAFREWTESDSLYGSREFVTMLRRENEIHRVAAMILLDLVGGRQLQLFRDIYSTDWLKNLIWAKAAELGYEGVFRSRGTTTALDDHIPFARAGIPVVDIIDLHYEHWHRASDTPDKLSTEMMEIVGNVVLASLPDVARYLERSK